MALYIWGFGKYGQLGNGATANVEVPQLVKPPSGFHHEKVSCGGHFTAVLCSSTKKAAGAVSGASRASGPGSKRVLACGWGKYGRLGTGSEEDKAILTEVLLDPSLDVSGVSAGHWHACCIAADGSLHSWGYNKSHGVLGLGMESEPGATTSHPPFEPAPNRVLVPPQVQFVAVSCGYNYTYAISAGGKCYSWGSGKHGVLGHGDTGDRNVPSVIEDAGIKEKCFKHVSCGYGHAALVESSGGLYTVGSGADGALGHGRNKRDKDTPTLVRSLTGVEMANASCSHGERHAHTLACTLDGSVFSWGDGYKGKLGHGSQESCDEPRRIDPGHFLGQKVINVSCGGIHSAAMSEEGSVFTWGCGSDGRLGHPEAKGHRYLFRSDVPRVVEGIPKTAKVVSLSCSYYHSAVVCCPIQDT